jgi:hypothetical protein
MVAASRWRDNWRIVSPAGAVAIELHRSRAQRRRALERARALPASTPVTVITAAPGAARRGRRFAAQAGIVAERRYLAFPSAAAPGCLVEDVRPAIRLFAQSVLVLPPHAPLATALGAVLALVRLLRPWRAIRALAPGRVIVGRRR